MNTILRVLIVALSLLSSAKGFAFETAPSPEERDEVAQRLRKFYRWPSKPGVMDEAIPKYDAASGSRVHPNPRLQVEESAADPLLNQAQAKALDSYSKERCTKFLKKNFPSLNCGGDTHTWETARAHDQVEDLASTWVATAEVTRSLDGIPVRGDIRRAVWSGDYWAMRAGLTSYRYGEGVSYSEDRKAVAAYAQPSQWEALLSPFDLEKMATQVLRWSPAEKYDVMTGVESFSLTQQQKREGASYLGEDGNVEGWFGICHGWAPASVFVDPPLHPVNAIGARGVKVTWYPDDIRALVTLAWANGQFRSNFVGGRCNAKNVDRFENGRVSQPECFDNNPATFHLALGNLIGRTQLPFLMDASFDHEVWNQPVIGYELEYFNPLDGSIRSSRWQTVAIPYDQTFKQRDRFQRPKTRGVKGNDGQYDDSQIQRVVGVIATVTYLSEVRARHSETPRENNLTRVTYTYDLELHEKNGELVALGGEWHSNVHPDFLWMPRKGSFPTGYYDQGAPPAYLDRAPSDELAKQSELASVQGYPLCKVIAPLVEASTGQTTVYICP